MYLKSPIIVFGLVIFLLTGCFGQQKNNHPKQSFPDQQNITESLFIDCATNAPDYLDMYNDSVLMLVNSMPTGKSKYHFSLYDAAHGKLLSQRIEFGRKYGQAMGFLSSGVLSDGNIWAYDINKKTVVFNKFKNILDTSSVILEKNLTSGFYRSLKLLDDSTAIGSGNFNSDNKIDFLNLSADGKPECGIVPYGHDANTPASNYDKSAMENFLFIKPSHDRCVLAYRYTDKIEIVNLKTGESRMVYGPDGFDPQMNKMTGPDGKEIAICGNNTIVAFLTGMTTENYIYLLFSGRKFFTENFTYGNSIYVYSWDGNPVKKINLSEDIQAFAVSSDDASIYTYDAVKKQIRIGKLK
ncbi:BF3164 family lipoprotein [Danxiaibacter flavus]|uniref:BF3164 family lipoprotein n=1 Tax=Danxiaibacter flavus TaxID=3049108 RepID=A0ABV3ZM54_9BACT|nr:BF3164 family lipoprotein [Chitinophagaceae bacterium DXS]